MKTKTLPGLALVAGILLVVTALAAGAQTTAPSQPVIATIDATKTGPPISPYVYGQFLEHAGGLIYGSLWSEMLDDRKFHYDVTNRVAENPNAGQRGFGGFPGRRNVGPGRWNPVGPADSVVMDANNPFVGDHTPLIKLAGSEPRGIRQAGVNFTRRCHLQWPHPVGWRSGRESFHQYRLGHQR